MYSGLIDGERGTGRGCSEKHDGKVRSIVGEGGNGNDKRNWDGLMLFPRRGQLLEAFDIGDL